MLGAKDLDPVGEFQIGGHQQGDLLMQGGTELEDQLGSAGGKRDVAQLIQDDQVLFELASQSPSMP